MKINTIDWVALVLVIVGGLNWGLVGAFNFNLVDGIFGVGSLLSKIVYIVVGLASVYMIYVGVKLTGAGQHDSEASA